jgi:NAD(P)-dependent dehydrogenase (short-subunit alcohol dehydrogenase family)
MPAIFVTGSNRGLGLEWVRQYAHSGWEVYATCRDPDQATDLKQLAYQYSKITILPLDVTHDDEIHRLAGKLTGRPIDLLINNAGVYFERWGKDELGTIDYRDWEETFRVNSLGAVKVTEALAPNVAMSDEKLVVAITSHMGSIADITSGRNYAYRSSKAALNAAMKGLAYELQPLNIAVLLLHPGWVRTRMGGSEAPYSPSESVSGMRRIIANFDRRLSGAFFRFDGRKMPW